VLEYPYFSRIPLWGNLISKKARIAKKNKKIKILNFPFPQRDPKVGRFN
jgi:hypothetical protein